MHCANPRGRTRRLLQSSRRSIGKRSPSQRLRCIRTLPNRRRNLRRRNFTTNKSINRSDNDSKNRQRYGPRGRTAGIRALQERNGRQERRLYPLSGQRAVEPLRHRGLPARRRSDRRGRHRLQIRHRVGIESADGDTRHEPVQRAGDARQDWRRRDGTAFQLDHGDPAGERPPLDAAGECRCDQRLLDGETRRRQRRQMEVDRRFYRRAGRIAGRSDRRIVQIGDGDQLQQQVDRMAAEELQPDLRRSRHVAGHLHAPVFDRRDGQAGSQRWPRRSPTAA